MAIDVSRFRQTYFEESFEGLDAMESGLLDLEIGAPDTEVVNAIFRAAHSIKGGSGTFGFTAVTDFTHVLETLLDEMRDGRREVTREAVDVLLESVDVLRGMMQTLHAEDEPDPAPIEACKAKLLVLQGSDSEPESGAADPSKDTASWRIGFDPNPELLQTGNDAVLILRELAELAPMDLAADVASLPSWEHFDPETCYLRWTATFETPVPREDVLRVFEWVEDVCHLTLESTETNTEPDALPTAAPEAQPTASNEPSADRRADDDRRKGEDRRKNPDRRRANAGTEGSIRVSTDKVDGLLNLVGELVITQAMLGEVSTDFSMDRIEDLKAGLTQLAHHTRELQESVMRIRMLPIEHAFSRLPRIVHDTSQKLGKQVELVTTGESTELDKTVLEKIGDPLVHLVRNAIDHGIESPEARAASGKDPFGTVTLHACHQGGNVVIEITDDGKGLDLERILAKAVDAGVVDASERPGDDEIADLIFHPGLSTADQVSDVSGRGVGMDVVRGNITELGGSVAIDTELGRGTRITIRLPLTLAILDGQLVRVGSETYVIPLVSIVESLQIRSENVNTIAGKAEVYRLRDENIPVLRLYDLLGVTPDHVELDGSLMVVVDGNGTSAGLLVDELLAQQQVVIKSLETNYRRVPGLSGATILGDGTVALILDAADLVQLSRTGTGRRAHGLEPAAVARS